MARPFFVIPLLGIIYLSFISLGLPDSILGVSLPAMQQEWGFDLSLGGVISMLIIGGTVISSLLAGFLIGKLTTPGVLAASCLATSSALFCYSASSATAWLPLFSLLLGFGGGSVDIALNSYVALHFRAHHMNWLHSFWGVGATMGPLVISFFIDHGFSWRAGYRAIAGFQLTLIIVLLFSVPLWRRHRELHASRAGAEAQDPESVHNRISVLSILGIKGVMQTLLIMLLYCGIEVSVGLWGSSFLVTRRSFSVEQAAVWIAVYYGGITAGRLVSGFISYRVTDTQMIRGGLLLASCGIVILFLPLASGFVRPALACLGFGLAPVFPTMIHAAPARFGRELSGRIISLQMGSAYIGSALLPPLLGLCMQFAGLGFFPVLLAALMLLLLPLSERLAAGIKSRI